MTSEPSATDPKEVQRNLCFRRFIFDMPKDGCSDEMGSESARAMRSISIQSSFRMIIVIYQIGFRSLQRTRHCQTAVCRQCNWLFVRIETSESLQAKTNRAIESDKLN